jgi:hypothetical protein
MPTKKIKEKPFPLEKINGPLPKLQQADIVLVHTKHGLLRYLIRKVTNSYWDHAALILFTKNIERGRFYDQIIEAVEPKGIEVHKLEKYLKNPNKYDIGIKRIPNLDKKIKKRVIAFMLMNVDAPYYRLSRSRFFIAAFSKKFSEWFLGRQRYSCTGLVQKSFYEAVEWGRKEKFIFKTGFLSPIELQEITTPADIANSKNTFWIYNKK